MSDGWKWLPGAFAAIFDDQGWGREVLGQKRGEYGDP